MVVFFFLIRVSYSKTLSESSGIIPSSPPVNLHTSSNERHYKGYGFFNFSVILPQTATPEFTLGYDEGAEYDIGDTKYTAYGFVYVNNGKINATKSTEGAWIVGVLTGDIQKGTFSRDGQAFSIKHERSGFFIAKRNAFSKRLHQQGSMTLDYNFTSMYTTYWLSGDTWFASEPVSGESYRYLSDFSEDTLGIAYRPMLTLQPSLSLNDNWTIIPFIGATAFITASYNSWYVNEWEDVLYGQDCLDGCEDDKLSLQLIPLEIMIGLDVEWDITLTKTLSLSSFFSPSLSSETESMSEIYLLYSISY